MSAPSGPEYGRLASHGRLIFQLHRWEVKHRRSAANNVSFGEDFALWLVERLKARSIEPSEPIQEDWGWALIVPYQGSRFTLSIGIMDDSIGHTPAEWRVGVSYEKWLNGLRAWFRPPPVSELSQLAGIVEETLRSESRIQQVASE